MSTIVVVESPAKAKTINKYLGKEYSVIASYGHVRDLPPKNGSVDPENDFAMIWTTAGQGKKHIDAISKLVKSADKLVLATDPDREGEAISWHILEELTRKKVLTGKKVERVAFNEITKRAVQEAIAHPRDIDEKLVNAYLARRALDYLFGFTLSPVLWRKLPGSRSAGRVQSVALRLICERENEIEAFNPEEYWSVAANFKKSDGKNVGTLLTHLEAKKLKKMDITDQAMADGAVKAIKAGSFTVTKVVKKQVGRNPAPAFTTSTLQQEASRKLGFGASRTMSTAQRLYEAGHITYMRTDSVNLSNDALNAIRAHIGKSYGKAYLPEKPRFYKGKAKFSQDAHEAIRPSNVDFTANNLKEDDQRKLYLLIWKRAVACQMESARLDKVAVDLADAENQTILRANGSVIAFDGFMKLYLEGKDDSAADGDPDNRILPPLSEGEALQLDKVTPEQHFTKPPPRYSEATLVKNLEELGIGRPSTYASIIQVLQARSYVRLEQKRFFPENRGRIVTTFLSNYFPKYVEYEFTALMEDELDQIAVGEIEWRKALHDFWGDFKKAVDETQELRITDVIRSLNEILGPKYYPKNEKGEIDRSCPSCEDGRISLKLGKNGAFIGCSNYPECSYTRPLIDATEMEDENYEVITYPKDLGEHPETGDMITLRMGPYGVYVQLGEKEEGGENPKRAALPKGIEPKDLTFEKAVELLRLPREVGLHPETGLKIVANIGRFGPYIMHDGLFISLKEEEELFTIGINHAVDLIAEKEKKVDRRLIGHHPKTGTAIHSQKGRYGYFVQWGQKKAFLPKGVAAKDITIDEALELLAKEKGKGKSKTKSKPTSKSKPKAKTKSKSKTKAKTKKKKKKT